MSHCMITEKNRSNDFWYKTSVAWFRHKIVSQMLKQALNFTWKALINSFKPLCKQIDYQTLNRRSHPALFMNQSPRGIMRSAVPLPCFFDVVRSWRVTGLQPQQGTKSCRIGRNSNLSIRPSVCPPIHLSIHWGPINGVSWWGLRAYQRGLKACPMGLRACSRGLRACPSGLRACPRGQRA